MQPGILPEFGMERESHIPPVLDCNDLLIDPGQNLQVFTGISDNRCTDEDCMERASFQPGNRQIDLKGLILLMLAIREREPSGMGSGEMGLGF